MVRPFFSFRNFRLWRKFPDCQVGQVVFVGQDYFLSDENTTCYVRLNIESSFVGLLRDVHGVL
ncbi:hypothetical protein [Bacteroides xylanisolvens]|uniref:hypothetical protein n=1 Tax=Bacteroides xylanisolvens TaxID=371601 RepID=UPI002024386C|nr:hypothetical protein [Bacteroides xylanisolvens]